VPLDRRLRRRLLRHQEPLIGLGQTRGHVMPGESPAVFGDALRRLSAAATYLYQDGARHWYATQATVTKLAEDRAEQLKREPDKVAQELEHQLREDLRTTGEFSRVHILPHSGGDVPDDYDARLVVLGPEPRQLELHALIVDRNGGR
jgi:hypothetical protein